MKQILITTSLQLVCLFSGIYIGANMLCDDEKEIKYIPDTRQKGYAIYGSDDNIHWEIISNASITLDTLYSATAPKYCLKQPIKFRIKFVPSGK